MATGLFMSCPYRSSTFLSRNALTMTDTELNVMAALAIIGLSTSRKKGTIKSCKCTFTEFGVVKIGDSELINYREPA
jgi:hypothetical protein